MYFSQIFLKFARDQWVKWHEIMYNWKPRIVMMPTLSSLEALEAIGIIIYGAASDEEVSSDLHFISFPIIKTLQIVEMHLKQTRTRQT